MQVLHAFPEADETARDAHLDVWFGVVHVSDRDDDDPEKPVVCYCGARLEPLRWKDGDVTVAAVWHLEEYKLYKDRHVE
jgi:hypothetical protein